MIIELILKELPKIEIPGYERIELSDKGALFSSLKEDRVDMVIKRHIAGKVRVFTDRAELVKRVIEKGEIVDIIVT